MVNPYKDNGNKRVFLFTVNDEELIWHRDKEDRIITVINGKGWSFQFDNQMPIELTEGSIVEIPAMVFHRIFKNSSATDLHLTIEKHRN